MDPLLIVALVLWVATLVWFGSALVMMIGEVLVERKRVRLERELADTRQQLHARLLDLASEMHRDGYEARIAMLRESFDAAQVEHQSRR